LGLKVRAVIFPGTPRHVTHPAPRVQLSSTNQNGGAAWRKIEGFNVWFYGQHISTRAPGRSGLICDSVVYMLIVCIKVLWWRACVEKSLSMWTRGRERVFEADVKL